MTSAAGSAVPGKVVVGDQYRDAQCSRRGDALDAGHAIVHGHDQRWLASGRLGNDSRRKAVAEPEPVRHQEIGGETPAVQRAQHQGRAGGAIGIEIADDEDPSIAMRQQQARRSFDALQ